MSAISLFGPPWSKPALLPAPAAAAGAGRGRGVLGPGSRPAGPAPPFLNPHPPRTPPRPPLGLEEQKKRGTDRQGVIPEGEQAGQGGRAGTNIWGKSRSPGWNASRGTLDAVSSTPPPPRRTALAPLVLPPESLHSSLARELWGRDTRCGAKGRCHTSNLGRCLPPIPPPDPRSSPALVGPPLLRPRVRDLRGWGAGEK